MIAPTPHSPSPCAPSGTPGPVASRRLTPGWMVEAIDGAAELDETGPDLVDGLRALARTARDHGLDVVDVDDLKALATELEGPPWPP